VPRLKLGKQAALHLRTVALGAEDGDRKRSCPLNTRMSSSF
jgi:hypothetical protein